MPKIGRHKSVPRIVSIEHERAAHKISPIHLAFYRSNGIGCVHIFDHIHSLATISIVPPDARRRRADGGDDGVDMRTLCKI